MMTRRTMLFGDTPPNGPSGASGMIGKSTKVMASRMTAERSSTHCSRRIA